MKRQRNMAHMKEQIKIPEKELNEIEISYLRCRVQNTGYKDAQGTYRDPQLHKKRPSQK